MGTQLPLAERGQDGRHLHGCPLCEAMCGLEVHVEGGRVTRIRGNRDDAWSRGHIAGPAPRSRERLVARARRGHLRHRRDPDPGPGTRARRRAAGRRLRPNRAVQSGVRQPCQLAGRRGEHPHRTLRHTGRRDVPAPGGLDPDHRDAARAGGRRSRFRALAHPGARREGGPGPGARVLPDRGDRHTGRRPDQGADHGRGQSRAVHPWRAPPRRGITRPRSDDLGGHLPQRDHQTRRRHPARPVSVGAAPSRRSAAGLRDQQLRELLAAGLLPRGSRPARRVGDPHPPHRAVHRHPCRGRRCRGDRRRVLRLHGLHPRPRRCRAARAIRRWRTGTDAGPDPAHRPVRRPGTARTRTA